MRQFGNLVAVIAASVGASMATPSADFDFSKNVTLSTTMRVIGTSPACTLAAGTGSLTYATGVAIKVTIQSSTTFKISYDGGQTDDTTGIPIPNGSTYTVPGGKPAAGNVIGFGSGTYATNDTVESATSSILTADAGAYSLAQGTASNQIVYGQDATGRGLKCVGGSHSLESTNAALLALSANDPALEIIAKVKPTTASASGDFMAWSQTGGTSGARRISQVTTGTGRLAAVGTNDAGSAANSNITRAVDDLAPNGTLVKFSMRFLGSGAGLVSSVNDANDFPSSGTSIWNPGTVTHTRLSIGCTHDNAFRRQFNGMLYRILIFNQVLSAAQRTAWFAAL